MFLPNKARRRPDFSVVAAQLLFVTLNDVACRARLAVTIWASRSPAISVELVMMLSTATDPSSTIMCNPQLCDQVRWVVAVLF